MLLFGEDFFSSTALEDLYIFESSLRVSSDLQTVPVGTPKESKERGVARTICDRWRELISIFGPRL